MSIFTEFTSIRSLPKKKLRITTKDLVFFLDDNCEWKSIKVDCWFTFNWASTPRLLWIFFPPVEPDTINSACLHDFIVKYRLYWYIKTNWIFYKWLKAQWSSFIKRWLMFIGTMLGCWISYYRIIDKISEFILKRLKLSEKIASKIK